MDEAFRVPARLSGRALVRISRQDRFRSSRASLSWKDCEQKWGQGDEPNRPHCQVGIGTRPVDRERRSVSLSLRVVSESEYIRYVNYTRHIHTSLSSLVAGGCTPERTSHPTDYTNQI